MNVLRGKRSQPWRTPEAFTGGRFFDVRAAETDGNESLGVIMEVARPVIADEVMEVRRPGARLQERPPVEIGRTALSTVDLLVFEEAIQPPHDVGLPSGALKNVEHATHQCVPAFIPLLDCVRST